MLDHLNEFAQDHWRDGIEILILSSIVYSGYRYFKATRGARILSGLLLVFVLLTLLSQILELAVIAWLIKSFSVFLAIALVVIFQPELRRALAELGSHRFFSLTVQKKEMLSQLREAVRSLSKKRFGALVAIERGIDLKAFAETGVELDSLFSPETALAIFHPKGALHDGGMILRQDRIAAAGCVFPVSQRELLDRSIGLRHRAGIGITEESDAVAIVISEETGSVSICHDGVLERDLAEGDFERRLDQLLFLKPDESERDTAEQLEGENRQSAAGDGHLV
ncbi:MAG: diadenylate cyclase CdaA, partial [Verrucomicrobiales bacterium]